MTDTPIDPAHTPDTFGTPQTEVTQAHGTNSHPIAEMTVLDCLPLAPDPAPGKKRPAVKRLLAGDRANLIVFNFAPGQSLPDHKAAHPITVQCLEGTLEFNCGDNTITLAPGVVAHLPAYSVHRVDCPTDSTSKRNVLLLTMLTGESPAD